MTVTLTGPDPQLLALATVEALCPPGPPLRLEICGETSPVSADWLEETVAANESHFRASWDPNSTDPEVEDPVFTWMRGRSLVIRASLFDDLMALAERVAALPFELATISTPFWDEWTERGHVGGGFGDGHVPFGWACLFKGKGHDTLCSRRFLDYGPWKKLRLPDDVTLIQFYDVAADAELALAQARPGHKRLQDGYLYDRYTDFDGVYDAPTRTLKIPVAGRELSQTEMRDACALRRELRDHPDTPVDAVGFTFPIPGEHEPYLLDLWLRELHGYAFIDHREQRVDQDFVPPPPQPPEWAR